MTAHLACGISGRLSRSVLLLSSEFPPGPGGIGTHAHQLALNLTKRGWHVTVAAPQELAEEAQVIAFNARQPYAIRRLNQWGNAVTKLGYRAGVIASLIHRVRPDVIIASGERMVWLASATRALHRTPVLAVGHAMEFNAPQRWRRFVTRHTYSDVSAVVCVSRYTRGRMLEAAIDPPIVHVIPNGADEEVFVEVEPNEVAEFRNKYELGDARLLLTVGTLHERKGQSVVIRALPQILKQAPDAIYVMIGAPYQRDNYLALAEQLGVASHVRCLGVLPQRDVVRALNAASLFVMTSQHSADGDYEGYGIAVVEAALCGTPSVVSDNSGVSEAIEDNETGLVARISDPGSTAEKVLELLLDPARLERIGSTARQRAIDEKTWANRVDQYEQAIGDVISPERLSYRDV